MTLLIIRVASVCAGPVIVKLGGSTRLRQFLRARPEPDEHRSIARIESPGHCAGGGVALPAFGSHLTDPRAGGWRDENRSFFRLGARPGAYRPASRREGHAPRSLGAGTKKHGKATGTPPKRTVAEEQHKAPAEQMRQDAAARLLLTPACRQRTDAMSSLPHLGIQGTRTGRFPTERLDRAWGRDVDEKGARTGAPITAPARGVDNGERRSEGWRISGRPPLRRGKRDPIRERGTVKMARTQCFAWSRAHPRDEGLHRYTGVLSQPADAHRHCALPRPGGSVCTSTTRPTTSHPSGRPSARAPAARPRLPSSADSR